MFAILQHCQHSRFQKIMTAWLDATNTCSRLDGDPICSQVREPQLLPRPFFQDFHVFKRSVARLDKDSIGRSHTSVLAAVTAVFQHFLECTSSYPTALNSIQCNCSKSLYCYIAILSISRSPCRTDSFTPWGCYMSLRLPLLKACHMVSQSYPTLRKWLYSPKIDFLHRNGRAKPP